MRAIFISLLLCASAGVAEANPIAIQQHVFIADETLSIDLTEQWAKIRCDLRFLPTKGQSKMELSEDASILLPIWLPKDFGGPMFKKLLADKQYFWRENLPASGSGLVDECAITLQINGRSCRFDRGRVLTSRGPEREFPDEAFPKGFRCVAFYFVLPKKDIKAGGKVSLGWNQPLNAVSRSEHRFFYLPIFSDGNSGTVENFHRISRIRNASGTTAFLSWDAKDATALAPHGEASLTLHHRLALKLLLSDRR